MSYIDINDVRVAGGFPSDLISNADITHAIDVIEEYVERSMNTYFTPVLKIEVHDGTNTEFFYTLKNPLLRIDYLKSNDSELDLNDIFIDKHSGKVSLKSSASVGRFFGRQQGIIVKYYTAFLNPSKSFHTTQADVSSGEGVVVELDNAGGLNYLDWVEIRNTEGLYTCAKITNVNVNEITLDKVVVDISSGSILSKLEIPKYIKRFIELESVIYLSLNAIGATYVFNASYSLGDLQVTKGVPYTHWRESLEKAIKERNTLKGIIKPRFKIM